MSQETVEIVKYDPRWPLQFESEQRFLKEILKPWIFGSIEHVGSTSVIGLSAKPIIDIMVGVESLESSQPAIDVLSKNGYCYYPYKAEVMHWFCKPTPEVRTHHLHLIPFESTLWQERIRFRDALRENPSIANEYEALKLNLAKAHKYDRELYTRNKWPFIKRILQSND